MPASTTPPQPNLRPVFALVAGEDSGDQLGGDLIEALKARYPHARFVGVGGKRMRAAGLDAWHGTEELSVLGFAEVLRHLPRLIRLRRTLAKRLIALKPAVVIGIDAPDFNLGLEKQLKRAGIHTVHYVSPSIWAWRERRAKTIADSAHRVLCLFPMEPPIYAEYGVAAEFVGHPMADRFPLLADRDAARRQLGLAMNTPVLAVLPGSRVAEVRRLGPIFLQAARQIAREIPNLQILIPAANEACYRQIERFLQPSRPGAGDRGCEGQPSVASAGATDTSSSDTDALGKNQSRITRTRVRLSNESSDPKIKSGAGTASAVRFPMQHSLPANPVLLDGQAHRAMIAADVVLLASGTAALEAMLAKRPMVVGYRLAPLTYAVVTGFGMLSTDLYALPNILAGKAVVPELMQRDCTPTKLADAVLQWFRAPRRCRALRQEFERMHLALHTGSGAAANAARAIERVAGLHPDVGGAYREP